MVASTVMVAVATMRAKAYKGLVAAKIANIKPASK